MSTKIEELERRAKFNPDPKNFFYLAEAYKEESNFEKALEACLKGLEKQPDLISAQILLSEILLKLGRLDESFSRINEVIKRAPDSSPAYRVLYETCLKKKDFKCAKDALEKLFFFNPFDEEIADQLKEINKIIEKSEKLEPVSLPEEESVIERGSAELKGESMTMIREESAESREVLDESEFLTKRIDSEDFAIMMKKKKEEKAEEEPAFITPTMAEIYLKQGLVDRAIETYYKLYEIKNEESFLEKAKALEEKVKKSVYYSNYINLLEKLLEKISLIKQGRS